MPLKKISDPPKACLDRAHDPPQHMCLEPGTYEWECPKCGAVRTFIVPPKYVYA